MYSPGCYTLEVLHFDHAVLALSVSYLITMHDSTRRKAYMRQLARSPPTATVIVVHNQGHISCDKDGVDKPYKDLWHVHQFIARYHLSKYDTSALIMEDDVHFAPSFRARASTINDALYRFRPDVYSLGSVQVYTLPFDQNHIMGAFSVATAVIYSNALMRRFGTLQASTLRGPHDSSVFWLKFMPYRALMLRDPVAGQLVEDTLNKQDWDSWGLITWLSDMVLHSRTDPMWMGNCQYMPLIAEFGTLGSIVALCFLFLAAMQLRRAMRLCTHLDSN